MDVLELKQLSAGYGKVPAVRNLDLRVGTAEVVALLGANGAGKTTTINAIAGLVDCFGGTISLEGRRLSNRHPQRAARLGVSLVPANRGLFNGLTVREHFRIRTTDRNAIDEILLTFPQLQPLMSRRVGLLSGGESQMLSLACGMVVKPKLLLIDELSEGLAPLIVQRLLPVVRTMAERSNTAVLLVEQQTNAALSIADRVYVLRQGECVLSGTVEEIKHDRKRLVESYLGTAAAAVPSEAAQVAAGTN